jgi:hypothetical protein
MAGSPMVKTRLKRMPDVATIAGKDGSNATLISEGLLKCRCLGCAAVFYSPSDLIQCCPVCTGREIEKVWTRPQTLLVPENESPTFFVSDLEDRL